MRLFRNLLLGSLLLALAVTGAAVTWRQPLLEAAGRMALARWGFEQAALTVTEVGLRRITVEAVSLGPGLPSVRQAAVNFTPHGLLRGQVEQIDINGLHLLIEGEGNNILILLERFGPEPDAQQESRSAGTANLLRSLPGVVLTGAEVTLRQTPLGDGTLRLDGEAQFSGDVPELSLQASLKTASADALLDVRTEAATAAAGVIWNASLTLRTAAGVASATLAAEVTEGGAPGAMQVEQATLAAQSVTLRYGNEELRVADFQSTVSGEVRYHNLLSFNGNMGSQIDRIVTGAGSLERLAARGPIQARYRDGRLAVTADGLTLQLTDLALPPGAGEQGIRVKGTVDAEAPLLRLEDDVLTASISVREGGLTVESGEKPLPVDWQSAKFDLRAGLADAAASTSGTAAVTGGEITVPDANIRLSGINATLPLTDGPVSLDLTVSDGTARARFTPAAISLSGERKGATVTAKGQASLAGGKALIPLTIDTSAANASGLIGFGPAGISFGPGALQPADLSPLLDRFEQVTGTTTVSGKAMLQSDATPKVSMILGLKEISATMDDSIQAEGLSGTLTFPSLAPLATAGEQRLTLRRLVAGVPLDDVDAVFAIPRSADGLTVELSEAGATLAGGRIRAGHAVYRNGAADIRVGVSNLPLERLLAEWRVEGVDATGLISGSLPVAIRPDGVAIQDGRLTGTQPGTIRVDFGSARQTLSSAGEQVDLAVRALENFQYKALALDVSKPLGGELRIGVGLDGNNPDVLEGYPFRFNITLSGRLEPILEAIRAGERISTDLLRGSLGQ